MDFPKLDAKSRDSFHRSIFLIEKDKFARCKLQPLPLHFLNNIPIYDPISTPGNDHHDKR